MIPVIPFPARTRTALAASVLMMNLLAAACSKRDELDCRLGQTDRVEIEKNCTGTYLRIEDRYHKVCNRELLRAYADGDRVTLHFRRIADCSAEAPTACLMAFPNDGWVEVTCLEPAE